MMQNNAQLSFALLLSFSAISLAIKRIYVCNLHCISYRLPFIEKMHQCLDCTLLILEFKMCRKTPSKQEPKKNITFCMCNNGLILFFFRLYTTVRKECRAMGANTVKTAKQELKQPISKMGDIIEHHTEALLY